MISSQSIFSQFQKHTYTTIVTTTTPILTQYRGTHSYTETDTMEPMVELVCLFRTKSIGKADQISKMRNWSYFGLKSFKRTLKSFIIGTLYRPPVGSKHLPANFVTLLNDCLITVKSECKETTILRDVNANYINKKDCKELKELFDFYGFTQIINKPTRVTENSQTLIDVILTTKCSIVHAHDVIPTSISNHDMVGYVRKMNHQKHEGRTIRCRNFTNYNHVTMAEELQNTNWNELYSCISVHDAWKIIKAKLSEVFDRHAPMIEKRVKGRYCPWLTTENRGLMNQRDAALRKAQKSKRKNDRDMYKHLKNCCTNSIRDAKSNYKKNLLHENIRQPRKFWQIIKELMPVKVKTSPNFNTSEPNSERPNVFCTFFTNVASSLKRKSILLKNFVWHKPNVATRASPKFTFKYVSRVFVEKELKNLKRNKATGIDNLPANLLKDCAKEISALISFLINLSLRTSQIYHLN